MANNSQMLTRTAIRFPRLAMDGWLLTSLLIAGLVAVPLAVIFLSFLSPEKEIWRHISSTMLPMLVKNTLILTTGVAFGSLLIGVPLAWLTATCEFPGRRLFSWILLLPMAMPTYVLAFVFVGIFDFSGPVQSFIRAILGNSVQIPSVRQAPGVIMVMTFALYPYVYLLAKSGFQSQGVRALEAAQSLGCSRVAGFFKVALPMSRPWIAGGVLLVVMETLADFGAVSIFNYDTFTTAIYKAWFGFFSLPAAAQLSTVLVFIVFLLLEVEHRTRRRMRFHQVERQQSPSPRIVLEGASRWMAVAACSAVAMLAFGLPMIQLVVWSLEVFSEEFSQRYLSYLINSVGLACITAAITVCLALILAYTRRRRSGSFCQFVVRLATLGYGLPGTVLAVGIFIPMTMVDNWLIDAGQKIFSMDMPPLFQGTILVMVLAYVTRFMAAGFKAVDSAMHRISPSIDEAARLMGLRGLALLKRVHVPMLRGGVLTGLTLVFVDVMKEMPITLMTRPFGWDTLAVKIFELTSEGEWQRAALPALALVMAGLVPIVLLMRRSEKFN